MRTRRLSGLLALCVAAASLAACGGEPNVAGDKRIVVYSGRAEGLVKPVLEMFTKASGIRVETRYGDTAQLASQLLEEGSKSEVDVYLAQDAGALGTLAKQNLFAPLPAEILAKVPPAFQSRNGLWVGVTGRARTFVYNPDLVPAGDLPVSVFDLTGPQWRGKVGIAPTNGSFQAFVTALRVGPGEAKAEEFLNGLKANGAQVKANNIVIVQDVADGKLPAGLVNHYYLHEIAKEKGIAPESMKAKLHFFKPGDPGNLVNVSGVGVLTRSATDPDTKALVEYLLGAQAQKYFAEQVWEYPVVADVPAASGLPAFTDLKPPAIDLNDLDSLQQTVALIKKAGLA
jgi:iron(III) transport system substrate-binding protein